MLTVCSWDVCVWNITPRSVCSLSVGLPACLSICPSISLSVRLLFAFILSAGSVCLSSQQQLLCMYTMNIIFYDRHRRYNHNSSNVLIVCAWCGLNAKKTFCSTARMYVYVQVPTKIFQYSLRWPLTMQAVDNALATPATSQP